MTSPSPPSIHADVDGTGPAVVFLHGAWAAGDMWEPQVDAFSENYRVVTVDVRGHGRSGPTDRRDYSIGLFSDDLRSVLADMAIEHPVLCGLSLGGLIAQTYALQYSDVRGLILADTVRSVPPIPLTRFQKHVLFPKLPLYSTIRLLGAERWFRLLLCSIEQLYGRPWLALDPDARRYALNTVGAMSDTEFIKIYDALYDFDPLPVSEINVPTILLTGDHETPTVRAQNRAITSAIDGAEHVEISNAGHLSNLDNPTEFNAAIESFLTRIGG